MNRLLKEHYIENEVDIRTLTQIRRSKRLKCFIDEFYLWKLDEIALSFKDHMIC